MIRSLLACVLAFAQFTAPPARAAIEVGTTVKVVNQVRAKTLDRRLKLGDDVVYQETVSTGRASAVDIRLIDDLITSAFHMPRAVGSFRRAGWNVVPYPVDYTTDGGFETPSPVDFMAGVGSLDGALHEWIGLAVYRLSGRTDALFPAPGG